MSKIDIIIPAYNAAHFLPDALRSVMAQTEQDWQIILVDDGSTDNTRDVVAPFAAELGSRLRYIHQENRGLAAARNTAIRNGDSPLLALLDADDLWLANRLADSIRSLEAHPEAGFSYGQVHRFQQLGTVIDTFTGNHHAPGEGWIAPQIYMRRIELPCPTITFRRTCVERVGLFDETMRATEDRDLWLRIAQHWPVAFIPSIMALYRMSTSSMSGDLPRMLKAQMQFIDKHYGEAGCGWRQRRIALSRAYKQQAEGYVQRGQPRKAFPHAFHALAAAPWLPSNAITALSVSLRSLGLH